MFLLRKQKYNVGLDPYKCANVIKILAVFFT